MHLLGVTGGVGMGKSTAGALLERLGAKVVDTDSLAREESAVGTDGWREIVRVFGPEVTLGGGELDRKALAQRVFRDGSARAALEAILHPRIFRRWRSVSAEWEREGVGLGVVVIPLLFEKGYQAHFSSIACVTTSASTQNIRLLARGWSPEDCRGRTEAQMPTDEKVARADFVIWTEGTVEVHRRQWERVVAGLGFSQGCSR